MILAGVSGIVKLIIFPSMIRSRLAGACIPCLTRFAHVDGFTVDIRDEKAY
jgi:hypothetical protein